MYNFTTLKRKSCGFDEKSADRFTCIVNIGRGGAAYYFVMKDPTPAEKTEESVEEVTQPGSGFKTDHGA